MKETFILVAFFAIIILIIYAPVIFLYVYWVLAERKFQKILRALEDGDFLVKCRIIITTLLGTGSEPAGDILFAEAMRYQKFAINSIMCEM